MAVRVKICGLARREDAEWALECGADALGFVYEPTSPRYVGTDPEKRRLPVLLGPYSLCVAVFGRYRKLTEEQQDALYCTTFQYVAGSPPASRRCIPVVRPGVAWDTETCLREVRRRIDKESADAVVLDAYHPTAYGGSGLAIDWGLAAEIVRLAPRPVILAGGLTPENVAQAVRRVRPYAVDVSSGIEAEPGVKDRAKVRDFIQAAKGA